MFLNTLAASRKQPLQCFLFTKKLLGDNHLKCIHRSVPGSYAGRYHA